MNIDDYNWLQLYKKCDEYMKNIKANEYNIATNKRSVYKSDAIVEVSLPKRNNTIAMMMLDNGNACIKGKGYKKDGKLYCTYGIYINRLN